MKKLFYIAIAVCIMGTAAFADKAILSGKDAGKETNTKEMIITDETGNKIKSTVFVPREHVPDVRIYNTIKTVYTDHIEYVHQCKYRPDGVKGNERAVLGGFSGDVHVFKYKAFEYPEKLPEEYKLVKTTDLGDGFTAEAYDIRDAVLKLDQSHEEKTGMRIGRNTPILPLEVVKDKGRVIWASSDIRFVSVERRGKGYIVIDDEGVGFLNYEGYTLVSDYYYKPFSNAFDYIETGAESPILSAVMLNDNIVRTEYKDGAVSHWKVKFTKEDCDKNLKSAKYIDLGGKIRADGSVIWHNGAFKKRCIAWNINTDTTREPEYK